MGGTYSLGGLWRDVGRAAEWWLARYRAGESAGVWAEMRAAGPEIRSERLWRHASAVATETMTRAGKNIQTLVERLEAAGYRFARQVPVCPPGPETALRLDVFEACHGPMPLSLRSFYDVVGTVDLTQSAAQLFLGQANDDAEAAEEEVAGKYDPLVVQPLADPEGWPGRRGTAWEFAADEFHKANYSGGTNYHVLLPDAGADFQIHGMACNTEFFVDYLRYTFQGGGFRGRSEASGEQAWKVPPSLRITKQLASGLLPI